MKKIKRGQWSSYFTFILAATGSAVGLGNIWKFPFVVGVNGGGAFVIVYLICIVLIGIPIMIAEVMLGKRGKLNPINTMRKLAKEEECSPHWQWVGWSGTLAGFIIFSFYSVISGWVLYYIFLSFSKGFSSLSMVEAQSLFQGLVENSLLVMICHSLFVVMTLVVVAKGIQKGFEKAVTILMPVLLILLVLLLGYSMNSGAFMKAMHFLFYPDFTKLSAESILAAMGQAFFTLSLASGAIMVYGSYLPTQTSIPKLCFVIGIADTAIALLSGLVVFPIVFAQELPPSSGPGLVFQALPVAFSAMPGGNWFAPLFFILFVFAAWTSSISMIEAAVSWIIENSVWSRLQASFIVCLGGWFLGLGTIFSFNIWKGFTINGKSFFDCLDFLTSNIMLPLGGIFIAIFVAWKFSENVLQEELKSMNLFGIKIWRWVTGWIAPGLVLLVFLHSMGVF